MALLGSDSIFYISLDTAAFGLYLYWRTAAHSCYFLASLWWGVGFCASLKLRSNKSFASRFVKILQGVIVFPSRYLVLGNSCAILLLFLFFNCIRQENRYSNVFYYVMKHFDKKSSKTRLLQNTMLFKKANLKLQRGKKNMLSDPKQRSIRHLRDPESIFLYNKTIWPADNYFSAFAAKYCAKSAKMVYKRWYSVYRSHLHFQRTASIQIWS